ncbi:hypothetical protein FEF34_11735 [Streptomyces marianii]|uniref:Uncharacterized protein n=1 Tax=Streptomyces marianii TaxID=1817406 RepID=A0A5R9E6S9_9ACTN|nr:hypothetical protein FEF34_11735 [Streptomyces marianii]
MVEQLQRLVDRYGECVQKPVWFRPGTWRAMLKTCGSDPGGCLAEREGRTFPSDRLLVIE